MFEFQEGESDANEPADELEKEKDGILNFFNLFNFFI